MKGKNRETLKNYFSDGKLPTQEHFAELIDSMLNMSDEGFSKSVKNGDEIYAPYGYHHLQSFYREQDPAMPRWRVSLSKDADQLLLHSGNEEQPQLCLNREQGVGIGTLQPQAALDVQGAVRSSGRVGSYAVKTALANGKWQPLTEELEGCQGFEVVAGAGLLGSGHFGLLHAIALNAFNPGGGWFGGRFDEFFDWLRGRFQCRRGIRQTQAWWGRRCDRLEVRWKGTSGENARYRLEIRSACNFGKGRQIKVQLTQLWFDPLMGGKAPDAPAGQTSAAEAGSNGATP